MKYPKERQSLEKSPTSMTLAVELYNAIGKLMRKLRKQSGKQPFSSTEQATMALLESNHKMLPSELAEAHHISAQGVSQIIQRLFARGCIEKSSDQKDKRKVYLSLTPTGLEELMAIRAARNQWLSQVMEAELDEKQQAVLKAAVGLLNQLAETKFKQ